MIYSIQEIQNKLLVVNEDIQKFVKTNKIKVGKDGLISEQAYQMVLDFYKEQGLIQTGKKNAKPYHVLNGQQIKVKAKPFFESQDQRILLFQADSINFLKNLPSNSVDVIITDPAYSGMNQRLKLGRGKIIGEYKKAGENGAKWFEEFHDTEENYKAFLQECYRVLKNNRHIYIMFETVSPSP